MNRSSKRAAGFFEPRDKDPEPEIRLSVERATPSPPPADEQVPHSVGQDPSISPSPSDSGAHNEYPWEMEESSASDVAGYSKSNPDQCSRTLS